MRRMPGRQNEEFFFLNNEENKSFLPKNGQFLIWKLIVTFVINGKETNQHKISQQHNTPQITGNYFTSFSDKGDLSHTGTDPTGSCIKCAKSILHLIGSAMNKLLDCTACLTQIVSRVNRSLLNLCPRFLIYCLPSLNRSCCFSVFSPFRGISFCLFCL